MTSPGGIIPGANQMVNSGKVRMIGCQMPCTNSLETNVKNIKAAIDKSQEIITQVDKARRASIHEAKEKYLPYIITPEGCLSGYDPHFDDYFDEILDAEKEVVEHAKKNECGMFLGTMYEEMYGEHAARRSQLRVYDTKGGLVGYENKKYVIDWERCLSGFLKLSDDDGLPMILPKSDWLKHIVLPEMSNDFIQLMLCNDMWGLPFEDGHHMDDRNIPVVNLVKAGFRSTTLIIHASNAERGHNVKYDKLRREWHNVWLKTMSHDFQVPIIHVDNCYMLEGYEYHGRTASKSGLIVMGEYFKEVPDHDTQYFYADFNR